MGQAKSRGSYEQRRDQAIEEQRQLELLRAKERQEPMSEDQIRFIALISTQVSSLPKSFLERRLW
jgi:hypothetical protein